jgi:hypothetical protein
MGKTAAPPKRRLIIPEERHGEEHRKPRPQRTAIVVPASPSAHTLLPSSLLETHPRIPDPRGRAQDTLHRTAAKRAGAPKDPGPMRGADVGGEAPSPSSAHPVG